MEENKLKYFKIIGGVQNLIAKSSSLEEALQTSLKYILDVCNGDYAVIYYEEHDGDNILHPYYWICPNDFTGKEYVSGKGIVGRTYKKQKTIRMLKYKGDEQTDKDFAGIKISSMVCVPLATKNASIGCIQIVKAKKNKFFTSEEADICEILALMAGMGIDENPKFAASFKNRKIIMSVKNVKKEFQSGDSISKVLKGVNLNVYEGEFLALLGESGCGKSTLLNIMSGMDKPTSGTVKYLKQEITKANENELTKFRRDNIGFIFQSYNLMPNLNAKQNLDLIAELVKDPLDSSKALELVGLGGKENSYPSQLSGGQQQRISIARSLIKKPKMIFADEPTAALDYDTSIVVLEVMERIAKSGTTLVMVTHNEEITKMADRVIRMRNGRMYEVVVNRHPCHAKDLVW